MRARIQVPNTYTGEEVSVELHESRILSARITNIVCCVEALPSKGMTIILIERS